MRRTRRVSRRGCATYVRDRALRLCAAHRGRATVCHRAGPRASGCQTGIVPGLGTLINVVAIVVGSALGRLIGHRLPERTNQLVTDILGLVVIVLGGLNVMSLADADYEAAVGSGGTLLVVLGALLIGGITGSALRIEQRLEALGGWLQRRFTRAVPTVPLAADGDTDAAAAHEALAAAHADRRALFITGFVNASLVFCIGPLAILGAFSDGTGQGIDQLVLKSVLDGFASIAFAATLGWGVALSALPVAAWQGLLTLLATTLGAVLSSAAISALTATGGVLLLGVGIRLLRLRAIAVGDMLPALIVAPVLTVVVSLVLGTA